MQWHRQNMRADRDWMDYANTAANVAQVFQLSGINEQLSRLQNIAAAQALDCELGHRIVTLLTRPNPTKKGWR